MRNYITKEGKILQLFYFMLAKEPQKFVQTLKDLGIFSKEVPEDIQQIPRLLHGRILSLGRVLSLIN